MQHEMMMTKDMSLALIEGVETGPHPMEEAMVAVDAPQVHTIGKEVALIMGMALHLILDLIEEAALTMAEPWALSMIDIKGTPLH